MTLVVSTPNREKLDAEEKKGMDDSKSIWSIENQKVCHIQKEGTGP